jgi:hypothetical protein
VSNAATYRRRLSKRDLAAAAKAFRQVFASWLN